MIPDQIFFHCHTIIETAAVGYAPQRPAHPTHLSLYLYGILSYPRQQLIVGTVVIFQQPDQKAMCLCCIHLQLVTVQAQENIRRKKGDAFVAVNKRVVHDERLKQRRRHFGKILVVASPGTM